MIVFEWLLSSLLCVWLLSVWLTKHLLNSESCEIIYQFSKFIFFILYQVLTQKCQWFLCSDFKIVHQNISKLSLFLKLILQNGFFLKIKTSSHNLINIDIFYGSQDFMLWKKIILYVLVQHGIDKVIDEDLLVNITKIEKARLSKRAYHYIPLHLSNDVLTFIADVGTTTDPRKS